MMLFCGSRDIAGGGCNGAAIGGTAVPLMRAAGGSLTMGLPASVSATGGLDSTEPVGDLKLSLDIPPATEDRRLIAILGE